MDNEITIPPPARRGWSDDARAPGCGRGRHVTASRRASVPPRPIVANSWQGALVSALTTLLLLIATDPPAHAEANCKNLPSDAQLKALLIAAQAGSPNSPGEAGGIFHGTKMWGAIVNRDGELCSVAVSTADPTDVWPGSQAIAKAKAYTANAFSVDELALSTARLYTFVQPGHSLFGLNHSNPFDPKFLAPPREHGSDGRPQNIAGAIITFAGAGGGDARRRRSPPLCCAAPPATPRRLCGGSPGGGLGIAGDALLDLRDALLDPIELRGQRRQLRGMGGRLRAIAGDRRLRREPLLDRGAEELGELLGGHHLAERARPRLDAVIHHAFPLRHQLGADGRSFHDLRPVFDDRIGGHRYRLPRRSDVATCVAERAASQSDTRGQHVCSAPRPAINEMWPPGSSMYCLSRLPPASTSARTHAGAAM